MFIAWLVDFGMKWVEAQFVLKMNTLSIWGRLKFFGKKSFANQLFLRGFEVVDYAHIGAFFVKNLKKIILV